MGALGEPILGPFLGSFLGCLSGPCFLLFWLPKGSNFRDRFRDPPGAHFLTMLRMRAHFPVVHSGPLWGCILVILRVPPGDQFQTILEPILEVPSLVHLGVHFGTVFSTFLSIWGRHLGSTFGSFWGSIRNPFWRSFWGSLFPPFGSILETHFEHDFGPPGGLLASSGAPGRPPELQGTIFEPPEPPGSGFLSLRSLLGMIFEPPEPPGSLRGAIFECPRHLRKPPGWPILRYTSPLRNLATAILRYTSPLRHFATAFPNHRGPAAWGRSP